MFEYFRSIFPIFPQKHPRPTIPPSFFQGLGTDLALEVKKLLPLLIMLVHCIPTPAFCYVIFNPGKI